MHRRSPELSPALLAAALLAVVALASLPSRVAPSAPGPHITELNVLLPPRMSNPVQYRLQATGGCFSWSWDHHDILTVEPEFNTSSKCSTSARLISIAPYNGRRETAVYATDLRSGATIRCKVFVDMISRIQIFHHAKKIDLDELATLRIRAFDNEENVFSSLVGLQFLWKLLPKSSEDESTNHLVHVPLKETPLSDCGCFCGHLETQIELEDRGVGSDLYVVQGVAIGHEVVIASLLEPQLEHVTDTLMLTVAEAMSLDPPSPIFITIGSLIRYNLRVIRMKTTQTIDLPSPHHRWHVMNSSVAQVDSTMGFAHALDIGWTDVIVEDTRVSGHVQTSSIHVVVPGKLRLYLVPLYNASIPFDGLSSIVSTGIWYIFPGQEYIIYVKAFTEGPGSNEIFITEQNDLTLESSTTEYWDLCSVPKDVANTYDWQKSRLLKPISQGQGTLSAALSYQRENSKTPEVITIVQHVHVCSKVRLTFGKGEYSKVIRLPWAPGMHQEAELKATGGCGKQWKDYKWFSSDETVAAVSASGFLQTKKPGQAIIKVVSVLDSLNYDEVLIEVSVPSSIVILPTFPVEVTIGKQLEAAVTFKTSKGDYFSICDAFTSYVQWKLFSEGESFKFLNNNDTMKAFDILPIRGDSSTLYGYPCAFTSIYASNAGRAVLHASLSFESTTFDGPVILKATISIAAYHPLVVYQAGNGNQHGGYWVDLSRIDVGFPDLLSAGLDELYLVPGSTMDLLLLGGPERWDQKVDFVENVNILAEHDLSKVPYIEQHEYSRGRKFYRVFCRTVGKFKLLFSRGNLVGEDHPTPAIAEVELPVICDFPSSITIIANEPANTLEAIEASFTADRSPGRLHISHMTVPNGCTIRLSAVSVHTNGRFFANSSSLYVTWELSDCEELAYLNNEDSHAATWERFLVLQNESGLCVVRATVGGPSRTIADPLYGEVCKFLEGSENMLTDAITLRLVSSLKVRPEFTLLVFHPEAEVNLSVTGGTCFIDAYTNDTQAAQISRPPESTTCVHLTVHARGLGTTLVTVRDIGLSPPAVTSAVVKVANVDWIKIISEEEIFLMEGYTRSFDILAGTEDGSIFDSSQYMYMRISVHFEDGILELVKRNCSTMDSVLCEPVFSIRATSRGITTVYLSVRQLSGYEVFSQLVKVEVYRPLRVHPEYVYLAPGASYVLTVKDGPSVGAFIEYSSMHEGTAIVEKSLGKVLANAKGNATIRASVYGNGGMLICEAYANIQVDIPEQMILSPQSSQLCVGCKMPIFPVIPNGDLFSFYEVCQDFKWMIADEKVITFQMTESLHADDTCEGMEYPCYTFDNAHPYINTLSGRSAGKTEVSVTVSCDFIVSGSPKKVFYNASKILEVVPDPPLSLGIPITWVLPPFYTTSELLPRLSHSYGHLDSNNRKSTSYSAMRVCGRHDQSKDTTTVDGGKIKTKGSKDLTCIQAKDQATGRTEIACCIRVAEVSQVRVATTESSLHVAYLAINANLELLVSYCDDLGYPFAEAYGAVPFEVETNRPDILSIFISNGVNTTHNGNENVILQAKNPGSALVRISINDNPRQSDFLMVSVGAQLYPRNPVAYVGQYINFSIAGDGIPSLQSGKWLSGNDSVISINRISGEGHALAEGTTQVIFHDLNTKLQTLVTVMKVNQIIVDAPKETLTNVLFPAQGYKFSVKFSPLEKKFESTGTHLDNPFDCHVEPPFIGYTKPWIDPVTRNAFCLFFPYSPERLISSMSTADVRSDGTSSQKIMYVSVTATMKRTPDVTASARALFIGGFAVANIGTVLNMTPTTNRSVIRVMGNTDVEINWKAKHLLSISPFMIVSYGFAGYTEYEVKVVKNQEFRDRITIALPANGQRMEIDVYYEPGEGFAQPGMSGISWLAVIICALLLMLTVFIFMRLLDRPSRPGPSRPAAPPPDLSSAGNVQSSPRTPQPFMEYVRRTVDETPYYKREGRRRFDPQYTY